MVSCYWPWRTLVPDCEYSEQYKVGLLTLATFPGDRRVPSGYRTIQQECLFSFTLENASLLSISTQHQAWRQTHSILVASLVQSLDTRIIPIAYLSAFLFHFLKGTSEKRTYPEGPTEKG